MTEIAAQARYIDVVEAAKMIRKHLKVTFPGVKFSVKSARYAGGASIDIDYIDGPLPESVRTAVAGFRGARFDGMIDLQYNADSWYCAKHGARTAATNGHSYNREDPSGTGEGNGIEQSRCCAAAELVHFGSGYVHEQRRLSPEFTAELEQIIATRYGCAFDDSVLVDGGYMGTWLYRESLTIAR
jgi:hypothetical protein